MLSNIHPRAAATKNPSRDVPGVNCSNLNDISFTSNETEMAIKCGSFRRKTPPLGPAQREEVNSYQVLHSSKMSMKQVIMPEATS